MELAKRLSNDKHSENNFFADFKLRQKPDQNCLNRKKVHVFRLHFDIF